jgi:WD40 repeat protein
MRVRFVNQKQVLPRTETQLATWQVSAEHTLTGSRSRQAMNLSQDSKYFGIGCWDTIHLWDLLHSAEPTLSYIFSDNFWDIYDLVVMTTRTGSPRVIAIDTKFILEWEPLSPPKKTRIQKHASAFTCLALSPDQQYVAVGTSFGDILLYDSHTLTPIGSCVQQGYADSICFSPSSHYLLSSDKRSLHLWDTSCHLIYSVRINS